MNFADDLAENVLFQQYLGKGERAEGNPQFCPFSSKATLREIAEVCALCSVNHKICTIF